MHTEHESPLTEHAHWTRLGGRCLLLVGALFALHCGAGEDEPVEVAVSTQQQMLIGKATKEPASKEPKEPASKEPKEPASKEPKEPASKEPKEPASKEPKEPASKEPVSSASAPVTSCGYRVQVGTYSTWPGGYQGWVMLTNVSGAPGVAFDTLLDVGTTQIVDGYQAVFAPVERGYLVSEPAWLQYQKIPLGASYQFGFIGSGTFQGIQAFITSINGVACDTESPVVDLSVSQDFFTSPGTLSLTAAASDDVAVRKVVFAQDGQVIGEDWTPPYTLDVDVTSALDGRHVYTATAVDPSGNEGSDSERVLVAIDSRFFGTAPDIAADYAHIPGIFDQLTPENGGKWGLVESTRDVFDWTELDQAYAFAQQQGLPLKLHTLFWGQQQPSWLAGLPAEEQLTEIHEWLSALAQRYPHLPLIDVVNEPINAPPGYAAALGGAGETGYDWMIRAFELARQYFPQSELILNEYNVLIFEGFTANYLQLVQLLQSRGLIDGIGLQGHFLERADLAVVEANLTTLAATGLPIYISELDVDLANDAHHADRLRDLLTVFWNQPSVVGVTHWGHLQGSTWRPNAFLVRQDGTFRPGLDWILCTRSGGSDCSVPEYVPSTRLGGEFGITLQAEEYDDAQGLFALGDVVAYVDAGDWIGYAGVAFQSSWDTFSVRYAKGNTDLSSSLSIHLGSLANTPVLTVDLPPTTGWGSFETIEVPWAPVEGDTPVFISFAGGFGIANVDSVSFGTTPPVPAVNLLSNGGFENGTISGWYGWGGGPLSASTTYARSGSYSLRRETGGTVATNATALVQAGVTYSVSFWVLVDGAGETTSVNVTRALNCGSGTSWVWLANDGAIPSGTWTELSGSLVIPEDCDVQSLEIYAEGAAGVDLYVDDVVLAPPPSAPQNLLPNGTFENGTTDWWYGWNGSVLSASTTYARSGSYSLRREGGGTVATNATALVQPGVSYAVSFWVLIDGALETNVNVTRALDCGSGTSWTWLANDGAIPSGTWTELSGTLAIPADCDVQSLQIYTEGASATGVDLYVDDVSLSPLP